MKNIVSIGLISIITIGIFCFAGVENHIIAQNEVDSEAALVINDPETAEDILNRDRKFKTGSFVLGLFGGAAVSALVFSFLGKRKKK